MSIRRACRVLQVDTSTYHYRSRRPGQAVLESWIKEICQTRVPYGYRRVHVLLRREGYLNAHGFMSIEDARQKLEAWRRYYNEERPHGAIGQNAPITLLVRDGIPSPPS